MDENLIKQAYAYGSAVALQELGFDPQQAEIGGIKIAAAKIAEGEEEALIGQLERPERPSGALPTLFGGLGALGAPKGKKWQGFAGTETGGMLGAAAGTAGGALAGSGLAALLNMATKGRLGNRLMRSTPAGMRVDANTPIVRGLGLGGSNVAGPLREEAEAVGKHLVPATGAVAGGALGGLGGLLTGRNLGFHASVDPREGVDY